MPIPGFKGRLLERRPNQFAGVAEPSDEALNKVTTDEAKVVDPTFASQQADEQLLMSLAQGDEPEPRLPQLDHDSNGEPGGSLPSTDRMGLEELRAELERLGGKVDMRFGEQRLRDEIELLQMEGNDT